MGGKRQGKGARKRAKEKRKDAKRARKEQQQKEWQTAAAKGTNRKKRRNSRGKRKFVRNNKHAVAYCGNLGCIKCCPATADPKYAKPGTALYGRQWSRKQQSNGN